MAVLIGRNLQAFTAALRGTAEGGSSGTTRAGNACSRNSIIALVAILASHPYDQFRDLSAGSRSSRVDAVLKPSNFSAISLRYQPRMVPASPQRLRALAPSVRVALQS